MRACMPHRKAMHKEMHHMSGCIARCARNAQAQLLWKSARAPIVPRLLLKSADTLHSLGLILKTQQFLGKKDLFLFLFGTAKMEPKVRIFQIIFEMWNFMIVWGITNSGEFLLNPPQLSRRLNRYSIRLTFLPETLPNCHKRFTISLLEIHWLSVSGVAFPFSRDFEISWSSLLLVILSGSVAQVCGSGRTWRTAPLVKDSE